MIARKDYVLIPALSLRRWRRTLAANVAANLLHRVWAHVVICCGRFADGAEKFPPAMPEGETKPEWYAATRSGHCDTGPTDLTLIKELRAPRWRCMVIPIDLP